MTTPSPSELYQYAAIYACCSQSAKQFRKGSLANSFEAALEFARLRHFSRSSFITHIRIKATPFGPDKDIPIYSKESGFTPYALSAFPDLCSQFSDLLN